MEGFRIISESIGALDQVSNLLNDLNTTQIHDALVIAGRLLPKELFFWVVYENASAGN